MSRRDLDRKVLAWLGEGVDAPRDDTRFETLALELFAHQYAHNPAYQRLCRALRVRPEDVARWQDIPPVPTGAFKEARLAAFPEAQEIRIFRTSGSTTAARGQLHLDTLELYQASLLATFAAYICPDRKRIRFAVLAPSAADAPDSSLSYMFEVVCRELGSARSAFYVEPQGWEPERLITDLRELDEPIALVGTSFAFVHLLDALEARGLRLGLPDGTRVMETGGFKGRSREVTRGELHGAIAAALGVSASRIVNQYGLCELGSQFYEPTLRTGVPTRSKRVPPWVRTRVVDPASMKDVATGERGLLVHYDLVNTGSVLAVQTSDLGRVTQTGLEILGRLEAAEARGCSIAADALLAGP
jgi:phenylacetate-coenzyme A ligase PaaK-like adenylate-forming protein